MVLSDVLTTFNDSITTFNFTKASPSLQSAAAGGKKQGWFPAG